MNRRLFAERYYFPNDPNLRRFDIEAVAPPGMFFTQNRFAGFERPESLRVGYVELEGQAPHRKVVLHPYRGQPTLLATEDAASAYARVLRQRFAQSGDANFAAFRFGGGATDVLLLDESQGILRAGRSVFAIRNKV